MATYDWIVIGAGITGSALSYELARQGFKVLLLEKDHQLNNATVYSYGGLAYWSGTTELTRQLCQESIKLHQSLSQELGIDTEFREIDLLLTIDQKSDHNLILDNYQHFELQPQLLDVQQTCELEPLLNPHSITGSLKFPHGQVNPQKINLGYQKALLRLDGEIKIEKVISFIKKDQIITGVKTSQNIYYAANTAVCTGGLTRQLLTENSLQVPIYFTHAQLIKTPPTNLKLNTIVMSANLERLNMEAEFTNVENEQLWQKPSPKLVTSIIETGGVQFLDGSICMGQISQIITEPNAKVNPISSETEIRKNIANLLPSLANLTGTWHNCLVAFTNHTDFLVGSINDWQGIHLFSGFTSPFVYAPILARHFANYYASKEDVLMSQLINTDTSKINNVHS